MQKKSHIIRNISLIFALGYLLVFLAFYSQLLVTLPEPLTILFEEIRIVYDRLIPPIAAAILLFTKDTLKSAAIYALPMSLTKVAFYLPYSYLYYLLGYHYDSLESLFLGLFASIGEIATCYITVLLLFILARYLAKKEAKITEFRDLDLQKDVVKTPLLQIDGAINKGVFYLCLTNFVYILAITVYDIVVFLFSYTSIKSEEYITMLLDISLCLATFVLSFIIAIFIKNIIKREKKAMNKK